MCKLPRFQELICSNTRQTTISYTQDIKVKHMPLLESISFITITKTDRLDEALSAVV